MGILGNMKVLTLLSRILTCVNCVMLKLIFVEHNFRLLQVQKKKKGGKRAKNKKLRFVLACSRVGNVSGGQYGPEKLCGEGVLAKIVF